MAGFEGYHGNEEDVYVKGNKQKPSVYKNTVHEMLPDPETENEKPGFDHFEDWNEDENNTILSEDRNIGRGADSYIAKSWQPDSYKTRAHEKELVEKAVAGSGRKKIKTPEQISDEKRLVEKILANIGNKTERDLGNGYNDNMDQIETTVNENIQNYGGEEGVEDVQHASMDWRHSPEAVPYHGGPDSKPKRPELKTLKRRALKDQNNPPFFKKLAKYFKKQFLNFDDNAYDEYHSNSKLNQDEYTKKQTENEMMEYAKDLGYPKQTPVNESYVNNINKKPKLFTKTKDTKENPDSYRKSA